MDCKLRFWQSSILLPYIHILRGRYIFYLTPSNFLLNIQDNKVTLNAYHRIMDPINIRKKNKTSQIAIQLSLWESTHLDPTNRLKIAMKEAVKQSSMSREQIVDEINRLAEYEGLTCSGRAQRVTYAIFDKWLAPSSKGHIIPLKLLPLFCHAVGSLLPLKALASVLNADVIGAGEKKLLEWAKVEKERRILRKKAKMLEREVGIK